METLTATKLWWKLPFARKNFSFLLLVISCMVISWSVDLYNIVISPPAISCRQEGDAAGRIPPCRPLPKLSASSCTLACKINLSKYLERVCWSYTSFRGISMLPLILSDESMDWIHWRRCCWAFIKCQIIFRAEAFLCKIYSQLTITVSKLQNFSIWLFLFNW